MEGLCEERFDESVKGEQERGMWGWRQVGLETGGVGDRWGWRRVGLETGGGDGSETGSVTKKKGKNRRLVSVPASPWRREHQHGKQTGLTEI